MKRQFGAIPDVGSRKQTRSVRSSRPVPYSEDSLGAVERCHTGGRILHRNQRPAALQLSFAALLLPSRECEGLDSYTRDPAAIRSALRSIPGSPKRRRGSQSRRRCPAQITPPRRTHPYGGGRYQRRDWWQCRGLPLRTTVDLLLTGRTQAYAGAASPGLLRR